MPRKSNDIEYALSRLKRRARIREFVNSNGRKARKANGDDDDEQEETDIM